MSKYINNLMNNKKQAVQKSIVEYLKYNIKNIGLSNVLENPEYHFLQDNLNGTDKSLTCQEVAVFCRKMVDIMIPYYQGKQVTAGVNEFFQMYKKLGDNQLKEKALLAYNFYFADTNCSNYPFKYTMDKSEGKVSCGRNFGNLQSKRRSTVMEEETDEKKFKMPFLQNRTDFFHLYPFGNAEGEITKRIYINTTPENATQIALELFKKCAAYPDDKNYRPYVKFITKDNRNDAMLAYCTEKNFDIMFDLVHEIYEEHKEWFNGTGKLPLMANICDEKNNHLILGVADEPTVARTSFTELFCDKVICPFKRDLRKKLGIDGLGELHADVIDKYVTYDALKPYIEKTCYSADYPFLTKDTVKKMQMQKTVANTQQATVQATQTEHVVESTQNHFQSLHDDKHAKDLTELGLV